MSKEDMRIYAKEYRQDGFGRIADRKYYLAHREERIAKQRERDRARANYRKKLRNVCEIQ